MTSTVQIARSEAKNRVILRVGGRSAEYVGRTVPAKTADGRTLYVRLTGVIKDYGLDDVAVLQSTFKSPDFYVNTWNDPPLPNDDRQSVTVEI